MCLAVSSNFLQFCIAARCRYSGLSVFAIRLLFAIAFSSILKHCSEYLLLKHRGGFISYEQKMVALSSTDIGLVRDADDVAGCFRPSSWGLEWERERARERGREREKGRRSLFRAVGRAGD